MSRSLLPLTLFALLTMSVAASASEGEIPSPEGEIPSPEGQISSPEGDAVGIVLTARRPIDPHAFSNTIKSSVNGLLSFGDVTVLFRPSMSGIALRLAGRF